MLLQFYDGTDNYEPNSQVLYLTNIFLLWDLGLDIQDVTWADCMYNIFESKRKAMCVELSYLTTAFQGLI